MCVIRSCSLIQKLSLSGVSVSEQTPRYTSPRLTRVSPSSAPSPLTRLSSISAGVVGPSGGGSSPRGWSGVLSVVYGGVAETPTPAPQARFTQEAPRMLGERAQAVLNNNSEINLLILKTNKDKIQKTNTRATECTEEGVCVSACVIFTVVISPFKCSVASVGHKFYIHRKHFKYFQ